MKKYINEVTVTGASDDTDFGDMLEIQRESPFVEWGILYSQRMAGKSNRFPSKEWLYELMEFLDHNPLNISVHLCGNIVNDFLTKQINDELIGGVDHIEGLLAGVRPKRLQINTHGVSHKYDLDSIESYLKFAPNVEFIAQYDEVNDYINKLHEKGYKNISALYDLSHGAGVLPKDWNKPLDGIYTGYAGGLSPDNLESQLQKLDEIVTEPIWIDAETWLRTDDLFDLNKVVKFLDIAKSRVIM